MRGTWVALAALAVLAVACGQRDDLAIGDDEPEPQPTVTVTVTATPEPEPEPEPDDEPAEVEAAVDDPCEDPPSGRDLIFVTDPRPGQAVESPFTVEGCSSTFEANVVWELRDADGDVLAEGHAMGGTMGEPDELSFEVSYDVDEEQLATLEVFEESAADGSRLHVNAIQLLLTP